ncbi:glycosyltransferase family 2 protein [Bradyrhizobium sp. USDA 4486]
MLSLLGDALHAVLVTAAILLLIPAAVLLLQVSAPFRPPPARRRATARPSVGVIVPAHNEERCIRDTLSSISSQLGEHDRLLVVADNCSDATAQVAHECGATVVDRRDTSRVGKGFAIDYGRDCLKQLGSFDVVLLVDADCRLGNRAVELLATQCMDTLGPVQAAYLMRLPNGFRSNFGSIKMLAWRIKNYVRPLGGRFWGFPCQLMGSGMAFPADVFAKADLATGHIVEDLKLGIDLALAGYPATFCPDAIVWSEFPIQEAAVENQRKRWEHGYISSMGQYIPVLLWQAVHQRSLPLLAIAVDLSVPPLALLVLSSLASIVVSFVLFLISERLVAVALNGAQLAMLVVSVSVIWVRHGRNLVSLDELYRLPMYVLSKLPLYRSFLFNRQMSWVKTDRDNVSVE